MEIKAQQFYAGLAMQAMIATAIKDINGEDIITIVDTAQNIAKLMLLAEKEGNIEKLKKALNGN